MYERTGWIFFDLDGTLADSLPALRQVYFDFLAGHGKTGTAAEFDDLNGPSLPEIVRILKDRHHLQAAELELLALYRQSIEDAYRQRVAAVTGADAALDAVSQAGYGIALVTSAPTNLAKAFIAARGWSQSFAAIITGEAVTRAKPFPDIYEHALNVTGAARQRTLVVEDSKNGIRAAKAAGLRVCGLQGHLDERGIRAAGGDYAIANLRELLGLAAANFLLPAGIDIVATGPINLVAVPTAKTLTSAQDQAVARIWEKKLGERTTALFNGSLLNYVAHERRLGTTEITGQFVEYRHFVAQRTDPSLNLGIRPVAVSGITIFSDNGEERVIFARRAMNMLQYPGLFELAPSGGLDRECLRPDGSIDFRAKVLDELAEETGLTSNCVRGADAFALIYDANEKVYDICCRIEVDVDKPMLETAFAASIEYSELKTLPVAELVAFARDHETSIVPGSLALIAAFVLQRTDVAISS